MLFTYIVFPKYALFFINQRDIEFEFVIPISFKFRENKSYFFDGNDRYLPLVIPSTTFSRLSLSKTRLI